MRHFRFCQTGITFVLILLLSGCQTSATLPVTAPSTTDVSVTVPKTALDESLWQYQILLPGSRSSVYLDSQGNILQDAYSDLLWDQHTNEQIGYVYSRIEGTGAYDEWGTPITRVLSQLRDRNGSILQDWAECCYREAFGNFLIRDNTKMNDMFMQSETAVDYHTALWNYKTGEEHFEGAAYSLPLENGHFLLTDMYFSPLAIVDVQGTVINEVPYPQKYFSASTKNGHIIVANEDNSACFLLDENFREICSYEVIGTDHTALYGEYFLFLNRDRERGVLDRNGKVLYTTPMYKSEIQYFDGELVILQTDRWHSENPHYYRLETVDGVLLTESYDWIGLSIANVSGQQRPPSPHFLVLDDKTLRLVDRRGQTVASFTASSHISDVTPLTDSGPYVFCVEDETGSYDCGLLDSRLNLLLPPNHYRWISTGSNWDTGERMDFPILEALYYENDASRYDILDLNGKPLVTGLSSVAFGPNRLAVTRGFSFGLMDWEGNWLKKHSIFQQLAD